MTSPCYRCHERRLRCHAECEAYREWKAWYADMRPPKVDIMTDAHHGKIIEDLRRTVKNRADGRKSHKED